MPAHQPGDRLRLCIGQPKPGPERQRDLGPKLAMIATAPLCDVVEQDGDIEGPPRGDVPEHGRGERMVLLERALLDPGEQADRPQTMLVNSIMVIHVELHLGDDAAEIGNEAAEHARLVHPAKHRLRIARRGQHIEEKRIGLGVTAHRRVDQLRVACRCPHRQRVDFEAIAIGKGEDADEPNRILAEEIVLRQSEPAAVEYEAFEPARPPLERRQAEAPPTARELLVEMGEEHSGQVPHGSRVEEIVAHEALDRRFARPVGVIHAHGDLALIIEGQSLLGAVGDDVEMAAHRPQEALGALELAKLVGGEQPDVDQLRHGLHPIGIFGDPEEGVEVAKPAFSFLDVGLDDIAAVAHPAVPRLALLQFLDDEGARLGAHHLGPEARAHFVEQALVAPEVARLQQGGADRMVAGRGGNQLVDRAAGMADLQAQVPEQIEQSLDHLLGPAGRLPGCDDGEIDVRMERHLAAAVAAHRHQQQPLGRGGVMDRIEPADDIIVGGADDLVGEIGVSGGRLGAGIRLFLETAGNLRPALRQRLLENGGRRGPVPGGETIGQGAAVDDRTLARHGGEAPGHQLSATSRFSS